MPLPSNDDKRRGPGGLPTALPKLKQSEKEQTRLPDVADENPTQEEHFSASHSAHPQSIPSKTEAPPAQDDSDVFETIPTDELIATQDEVVSEEELEPAHQRAEKQTPPTPPTRESGDVDVTPPSNTEPEVDTQDEFIDRKAKKLIPFGGLKSEVPKRDKSRKGKKGKTKDEYDARYDRRNQARAIQIAVIVLLAVGAIFGWYNAFRNKAGVSKAQVASILASQVPLTYGFPETRAQSFADNFLDAYLTFSGNSQQDSTQSSSILNYYYTGTVGDSSSNSNLTLPNDSQLKQKVTVPAQIFNSEVLSASSAQFTVGAYVTSSGGGNGPSSRWEYYNVGVYYNSSSNTVAITPNSPTPIPNLGVQSSSTIPASIPVGTGVNSPQLDSSIQSVLDGFITNWVAGSSNNTFSLQPFIASNPDKSVTNGLGGQYTVSGGNSGISYTTSPITPGDVNTIVASVTVNLQKPIGTKNIQEAGQYEVELTKQPNGKYLVYKIVPSYYTTK